MRWAASDVSHFFTSRLTFQTLAVSLFVVVGAWGLGVVVALSCFCFLFCKCFGIPNSPRILDLDDRQGLIASSAMQKKKSTGVSPGGSFRMRRPSNVNLQPYQTLRLPRNLQVRDFTRNSVNCFHQWKDDSTTIRPRPSSFHLGDLTRPILETHFVWKNTTFGAPAIFQNVMKCCACHEKSHSNFSK